MSDDKRKDLCNLLSYAEELLRITEKSVSDLSQDAVRVFHEHQIARLEGVSVGVSDDEWLRVARLTTQSHSTLAVCGFFAGGFFVERFLGRGPEGTPGGVTSMTTTRRVWSELSTMAWSAASS